MKHLIVLLTLITPLNAMSKNNSPPPGMSQEEWNNHLEINERFKQERKLRFDKELKKNPPVPPWVKYPEHPPYDIFWRMGTGETYLTEYMWPYLEYASEEELKAYKKKYPAAGEWSGWYDETKNS